MGSGARPTARVDGLVPPAAGLVGPVELYPGEVWSVGRRDRAYLAGRPEWARWHLGVPGAGPDLPVNQLEMRVGAVGVAVSSRDGSSLAVDGVVRPGPVVLTTGTSFVSPTVSGQHLDFAVTVVRAETFAARAGALAESGTTVRLRIGLDPGTAAWWVAHALAWPVMPTRRRAHTAGWSGRDVAERMAQLGRPIVDAGDARAEITVLGRQLLVLADKVANAHVTDGRRADLVFPLWPPWIDADPAETRDQRAERRNRYVADVLWRSGAVDPAVIDAGDPSGPLPRIPG